MLHCIQLGEFLHLSLLNSGSSFEQSHAPTTIKPSAIKKVMLGNSKNIKNESKTPIKGATA